MKYAKNEIMGSVPNYMKQGIAGAVAVLTEHAREIIAGSYKKRGPDLPPTDENQNSPEIAELAETSG
jgi:hypothetical protein